MLPSLYLHNIIEVVYITKFSLQEPYSVPLEVAAGEGHADTVRRLLEAGATVNYQNKVMTNTVLCVFCPITVTSGSFSSIQYLHRKDRTTH